MKNIIMISILLSGCATAYMRDRECHDRSVDPITYSKNDFMVGLITTYDMSSFSFTFKNQSKNDIKVVWNESFFVNGEGVSQRLFADGKLADKSKPTPDALVPAGSTVKSEAAVSDNVYFQSGWKYTPLCGKSVSPLGKLSLVGCDDLKLILTYTDRKSKQKAEFSIKYKTKLKPQCEGYNLETGEKLK